MTTAGSQKIPEISIAFHTVACKFAIFYEMVFVRLIFSPSKDLTINAHNSKLVRSKLGSLSDTHTRTHARARARVLTFQFPLM
jgi:hypothetical protein